MINRDALFKMDYVLIGVVIFAVALGVLVIYSAGFDPIDKINNGLYKKQILWLIFGLILMIVITLLNYQALGDYSPHIYGACLLLLVLTLIVGSPVRNTRAWLNFSFFSIQPSEFMKLALVLILAKYLEIRERDMLHFRELLIPAALTFLPMIIILKQPDFGTAIVFIPILFTMLFIGGADISQLVAIVLILAIASVVPMILTYREWIGAESSNLLLEFFKDVRTLLIVSGVLLIAAVGAFAAYFFTFKKFLRRIYIPGFVISLGLILSVLIQNFFKDYQKKRILVFLNTDLDPHGSGYNIIQSKIAVGSGGFFGKGFLKGTQAQLGFLPEKSSDFIFSVIAEEWGFFGAVLVLGIYVFIVTRGIQIALESKDKYGALLASGITAIFFFHAFVNIGMAVGIMPVTGLPLCFVSYGGSNLIMSMIAIGMLIAIRARKTVF